MTVRVIWQSQVIRHELHFYIKLDGMQPGPTFKRKNYYFAPADCAEFSARLSDAFPGILFRDGQRWDLGAPVPYKKSIELCDATTIYIWNPDLFAEVPARELNGMVQGASTRYVIQFSQCRITDSAIDWAQASASFDPRAASEKRYTTKVFRMLEKMNAAAIRAVDSASGVVINPKVSGFVVGAAAAELVRAGLSLAAPAGTRLELVRDAASFNKSLERTREG